MILKKIINWFFGLFKSKKEFKNDLFKLEIVRELPENPKNKIFYIEGDKIKNDFWYGFLLCPCGCKETITLNLINDAKPCWNVSIVENNFSVSPSIWKIKNCKSHFWIRDRKIFWCD